MTNQPEPIAPLTRQEWDNELKWGDPLEYHDPLRATIPYMYVGKDPVDPNFAVLKGSYNLFECAYQEGKYIPTGATAERLRGGVEVVEIDGYLDENGDWSSEEDTDEPHWQVARIDQYWDYANARITGTLRIRRGQ